MKIHCTGCGNGMRKDALALYLKETCGYGLTQAEDIKNMILDKTPVDIYIPSGAAIQQVLQDLKELGVECEAQ